MKKIKAAFVGIGGYGGTVLREILDRKAEDIEIVAAADPYPQSSALYEELRGMGVPVYTDMEEMLSETEKSGKKPDLVSIATPTQFHTSQIRSAIKRGINVLCEKPMTGDARDIPVLQSLQNESDKFIAIGYQWSYSGAIQALKADISAGLYGKAKYMKSLVLWPRALTYFKRSTGWAGKIAAPDGTKIYDSVVNNATAHYIHNIMYVLGGETDAAMPAEKVKATLLRVNDIETFDTATVRFTLADGTEGLFAVSHTTEETIEPRFEYTFEKGRVYYPDENGNIAAETEKGKKIYGDPFAEGASNKFFICADIARRGEKKVPCGVNAAKEEVLFVAKLHADNGILPARRDAVREKAGVLVVEGLGGMMQKCYREGKLLEELPEFARVVRAESGK